MRTLSGYEVALRALPALLQQLLDDVEEDVRMVAKQRCDTSIVG